MSGEKPRISVYVADAGELSRDDLFDRVYASVSDERKRKTDRYRFRKDKNLSLCAEYLLMRACSEFGVDYKSESVTAFGQGKPRFSRAPVCFSLSHSGERGMCVMSDREVGCDVEKTGGDHMAVARRFFSAPELSMLEKCKTEGEREELFCRLWTLKESFIKCTGEGLSLPLDSFSVVDDGEIIKILHTDSGEYAFFEKDLEGDYRYALCVKLDRGEEEAAFDTVREEQIRVYRTVIS